MSKLPALALFTRLHLRERVMRKTLWITLAIMLQAPIAFALLHSAIAMLA